MRVSLAERSEMLLLFSLLLLPLLINPALTLSFDDIYLKPKVWWIYGAVLPTAGLVIWSGKVHLRSKGGRAVLIVLGAFLTWLALSCLFTGGRAVVWWGAADRADGFVMHAIYALVLLAGFTTSQKRRSVWLIPVVLVGALLLAISSLAQQVGLVGVPGAGATQGVSPTIAGGTLGNRGYMGGALALILPLLLVYASQVSTGVLRRWLSLSIMIVAWACAGTFSRGAWLAALSGLIWLVWQRRSISSAAWMSLAAGLLFFAATVGIRGSDRSFVNKEAILTTSQRDVLWKSAVVGILERPVFGWGSPALWRIMEQRDDADLLLEQGVKNVSSVQRLSRNPQEMPKLYVIYRSGMKDIINLSINKVHNEYLDYSITYGLPSAMLFIGLLCWGIWSSRFTNIGLSAGLVTYGIYLMTWPEVIRFAPIAWFMIGTAIGLRHRKDINS